MIRLFRKTLLWIFVLFIVPALGSMIWWANIDRPDSWRAADWSSAKILPAPLSNKQAVIHVMSARTGGMKGALSQHSWIVTKAKNAQRYNRYDKVGWGSPVRKNAYAPDARWYSNPPQLIRTIRGKRAENLIIQVEKAIATYPHARRGGYKLWPGPNSNSFVAHVLRQVPELGIVLPPNAVGRDYIAGGKFLHIAPDGKDLKLSLFGLAGLSAGYRSGFELNFLGLVAGFDIINPALKIPGFGRVSAATAMAAMTR